MSSLAFHVVTKRISGAFFFVTKSLHFPIPHDHYSFQFEVYFMNIIHDQGTHNYISEGYSFKTRAFIAPSDVEHLNQLDSDMLEYVCIPFEPNITIVTDTSNRGIDDSFSNFDDTNSSDGGLFHYPPTSAFDLKIIRISSTVTLITFMVHEEVTWSFVDVKELLD